MTVPSTRTHSGPNSPDSLWKTRPETPPSTQRRNRLKTLTEAFRKVTPLDPRPGPHGHRLEKQAVVSRRHSRVILPARKDVLHPFPHVIRQHLPAFAHHTAPDCLNGRFGLC